MGHEPLTGILRHLHRWVGGAPSENESDGQLLERFATRHDEAAFATIMQRHGPLVLSVCRRLLLDPHSVEDAFQATFVVLVRRAAALKREGSLGSWLYTVAYRIALKARAQTARRRAREQQAQNMDQEAFQALAANDAQRHAFQGDLRAVLDDEVGRLPEKYRAPLILCYLEGKTNEQAACELGCPVGSMSWRLEKGRELLRSRLAGRGLALSAAALTAGLAENAASAAVPAVLGDSTLRSAMMLIAGKTTVGVLSAPAASLADGFLQTLWLAKLRVVAVAVLVFGLGGGAAATYRALTVKPAELSARGELADRIDRRVAEWWLVLPSADWEKLVPADTAVGATWTREASETKNRPAVLVVYEPK